MTYMNSKTSDLTLSGVKKSTQKIQSKLTKLTTELASFDAAIRQKKEEVKALNIMIDQSTIQ